MICSLISLYSPLTHFHISTFPASIIHCLSLYVDTSVTDGLMRRKARLGS